MLELFFDLVFVFVITQLTSLVSGPDGWLGYARAALVLAMTYWMYNGYAWLANNVPPVTKSTRLPMLLAMACFLAMAAAVPDVFGDGAWVFAWAYFVVVTIHGIQFKRSPLGSSASAIRTILPFNYGGCAMLFVAAALGPERGWIGWVLAVLILLASMIRRTETRFTLRTAHFVERHSLLVIIALGETIIATGVGSQGSLTHFDVLAAFAAAMLLISALWWIYFGTGDNDRGHAAMTLAPASEHSTLAFRAYSQAHLLHIAGLVLVAAGLHEVIHHPTSPLGWTPAVTLSAGVAVFLLAQTVFRSSLGIGPIRLLLAAVAVMLLLSPAGVAISGLAQLLCAAAVLTGLAYFLQRDFEVAVPADLPATGSLDAIAAGE